MVGVFLLRCSSTSEIVCGVMRDRTSVIKIEAGKESSGVGDPWRRVLELSMFPICSVGGGGNWVCSSVAIGAYTGPLVVSGCAEDVVELYVAGQGASVCVEEAKSMICGDSSRMSVLVECSGTTGSGWSGSSGSTGAMGMLGYMTGAGTSTIRIILIWVADVM